jgi:O-antigen/teichoic acid export membrane protein
VSPRATGRGIRATFMGLESARRRGAVVGMVCNAINASIGFVFVPEYIRQLGVENMAYVGLLTSMLALASVLDFGLGSAVSLRIASAAEPGRLVGHDAASVRRLLLWTSLVSVAIAAAGILMRGPFASWLFPAGSRFPEAAGLIAALSGLCLASRVAEGVARGGMVAAGFQARSAMFAACFAVVRVVGAALLLKLPGMDLPAFVAWNALILGASALNAMAQLLTLVRAGSDDPSDGLQAVRLHRFAAGAFATSTMGVLATQMDRIYLQGRIPESEMAAYCIAAAVLSVRGMFVGPMLQAFIPSMTRHLAKPASAPAQDHFDRFSHVLACVLIPPLLILALMPDRLLFAWTANTEVAAQGASSLRFLSIAAILNVLSAIVHALELAAGRTTQGLRFAACACVTSWMVLVLLIDRLGAAAGGVAHIVIYSMYLTVFAPRVLYSQFGRSVWRWIAGVAWLPLCAALGAAGLSSLWLGDSHSRSGDLLRIVVPVVAAWVACILPLARRFRLKATPRGPQVLERHL